MKTMTQHTHNDYDIDDGAAFDAEKLRWDDGTSMTPLEAKQMVKSALIAGGGGPDKEPTIKKNCVRVEYAAGHHVDIPVYRQSTDVYGYQKLELASGSEWRESNPTDITDWFKYHEKQTKVTTEDEPQLRRLVRLLKKYSRKNMGSSSLSGLILTVLTEESHKFYVSREDTAFRSLLEKIKSRLQQNPSVWNPKDSTEELTKDSDKNKTDALITQLGKSLDRLSSLDRPNCRRSEALKAWKEVFRTDFFDLKIEKAEEEEKSASKAAYFSTPYVPKSWSEQ